MALKILVDRNVERIARTHRTTAKDRKVTWGNADGSSAMAFDSYEMVRVRVTRPPSQNATDEQIPYLATVAQLARTGGLNLFTSWELNAERMRQPGDNAGWLDVSLFDGVTIDWVDSPVIRSGIVTFAAEEETAFFQSIRHPRFETLRKRIGEAHIADIFHLWTAEVAGLDIFMTMERRFFNAVENERDKLELKVKVSNPQQICEMLKAGPTDVDALVAAKPPWQ